jgi:hypothetical protein
MVVGRLFSFKQETVALYSLSRANGSNSQLKREQSGSIFEYGRDFGILGRAFIFF